MRARPASARAVKKLRIAANQHDLPKNLSAADYNSTPFRLFTALLYDSEKRRFCALFAGFYWKRSFNIDSNSARLFQTGLYVAAAG